MIEFTPENIRAEIKERAKQSGIPFKELMTFMRIAITGQRSGPDLAMIISVLGPEETMRRLIEALDYLDSVAHKYDSSDK